MTCDMEIVRKIPLGLRDAPTGYAPSDFNVDGYDTETIDDHVHLLGGGGLFTAVDMTSQQDSGPWGDSFVDYSGGN